MMQSYNLLPLPYRNEKTDERIFYLNPVWNKTPWQLPSKQGEMVITFPSTEREPVRLPAILMQHNLKIFDPLSIFQIPIEAPQRSPVIEKFTGERMLKIRRHKMRKHKRRKRFDRDYFKYQKYHRQKKAKAENLFRSRMNKLMEEYKSFDPEKYIKDIIACAKKDVTKDVAPSGRRKYPHWSTLVTLEELYGLPQSDYIDKRAGLASEEDRDKILQLKKEYNEKFRVSSALTTSGDPETKQASNSANKRTEGIEQNKSEERKENSGKPTTDDLDDSSGNERKK